MPVSKTKLAYVLGALAAVINLTSAVPFGLQIYGCTMPGVIAPGFDDGPWIYSEDILDRMEAAGVTATWFINGQNKGYIYDYNATLHRMVNMGHQIASHTWDHKNLATLTADQVRQEMLQLEVALTNILGYFPYYMRPPFLSLNTEVLKVLKELEYHVIIGDLNTKDWSYQTETGIATAEQLFTDGLDAGYTIIEAHDQEVWTHGVLIDYMIQVIRDRGLKTVTVAECLQDPNPYRTERSNVTTDTGPDIVYTLDGTCGNQNAGNNSGYTCPPNTRPCCSKYGYCGSSSSYCAYNVCQSAFGTCSPAPSSSSSSSTVVSSNVGTATTSSTSRPAAATTTTSTKATPTPLGPGSRTPDNTCGNQNSGNNKGYVCKTGECCSPNGQCGTTTAHCAPSVCQSAFGRCDTSPPGRGSLSPDNTCGDISKGSNNGWVCKTGQCCSKYGSCGSSDAHCAVSNGCQSAFGTCSATVSSSR